MAEFFLILGAIVIYFTPLLVAAWVRHPRLAYIGGLNAALGVTVVGWIGALIWALKRRKVVAVSYHGDMRVPRSFNTGLLAVAGLMLGVAIVASIGLRRLQAPGSEAAAPVYATDAMAVAPEWRHASAGGVDTASLQSSNSLTPPAPFKSGPATLSISHGAGGAVVRLDLDGELACSYTPAGNSIQVSFDGGPSQGFACAKAPAGARQMLFDGDHSTAYLADPAAFLARLNGARHVSIDAGFASGDLQPMVFDLPPSDPVVTASLAAARTPPAAMAAVANVPATAPVALRDDRAAKDDGAPHRRHERHARHGATIYVDGVPGHRGRRHRHAGA